MHMGSVPFTSQKKSFEGGECMKLAREHVTILLTAIFKHYSWITKLMKPVREQATANMPVHVHALVQFLPIY